MKWWKQLIEKIKAAITGEVKKRLTVPTIPDIIKPADPTAQPTGEAQVLWPAVEVDWQTHGWEGENEFRMAAVNKAREQGIDAIRFPLKYTDNKHLRIALWEWEHDEVKGKFRLDNFTRRARDKGIKRWVVDLSSGVELVWTADTFKAYGPNTDFQVQYTGIPMTAISMKVLECNNQGVKITPPKYR